MRPFDVFTLYLLLRSLVITSDVKENASADKKESSCKSTHNISIVFLSRVHFKINKRLNVDVQLFITRSVGSATDPSNI